MKITFFKSTLTFSILHPDKKTCGKCGVLLQPIRERHEQADQQPYRHALRLPKYVDLNSSNKIWKNETFEQDAISFFIILTFTFFWELPDKTMTPLQFKDVHK